MKKVLILGGASAIAHQTAKGFANEGVKLMLADLNLGRLEAVRDDILSFYKCDIQLKEFDAAQFDTHKAFIDECIHELGGLDMVLIAYGTLPDQELMEKDNLAAVREFNLNATSIISLSTIIANYFEEKCDGTLAVISSVAGDRGRKSNYLYGAAKGAITRFLQGLRNRLDRKGVKIVTIKPGMVDTPMTAHMPKGFLFSDSKIVGKQIYNAMNEGKDIVFVPGHWRFIMWIIIHIPEFIFKKLDL
ncbi:MAG: SDR family oxidoreductase [Candidatus Kapaibacterium sp.]